MRSYTVNRYPFFYVVKDLCRINLCGLHDLRPVVSLRSEVHCMQSVICGLQSVICSANARHRSKTTLFVCNILRCNFFSIFSKTSVYSQAIINVKSGDSAVPTVYQSITATHFLRIQPRSWYKESTLRVEIYGCIVSAAQTQGLVSVFVSRLMYSFCVIHSCCFLI